MTSYHIQDLRLLLSTHGFELHVNKHCAKIDPSFREWLQELPRGDLSRTEELSNNRFDLLCSLCFPTIDPPQLLRVSKSCALTFLASDGLIEVGDLLSHPLTRYVWCIELAFLVLIVRHRVVVQRHIPTFSTQRIYSQ